MQPDVVAHIDEGVDIALARLDFWHFCLYYDPEFFEQRPFLEDVADILQWVYSEYKQGISRKVGISMPPRAGKSYTVSIFCAWWLGQFPEKSVMRNTCTATLYAKFSYDVRNIVSTKKFKKVFPKAQMAPDKQNLAGWNLSTAKQVSYFGAGVGGTIIGFGANLALSDDLYKDMQDALSETIQEGVAMWKQSAHNSRMEKNCPEVYVGTRWTRNDEIGKATEKGQLDKTVVIPALNENGESFCDAVKSTEEYLKIKADTDYSIWLAEYQQEPAEVAGLLFPLSELKFYDPSQVNINRAEYKFTYVDPADEGGDFNAAPDCYLIGNRIYIPSVIFNKDGTDVNIPSLVESICTQRIENVEVEGNSAWILFGKDLRGKIQERFADCNVRVIKNTVNKQTRILAQAAFIKNHFYFRMDYESIPQYRAFIKNLTGYLREGASKNDDGPDSLTGVANHFKSTLSHLW